MTCKIQNKCDFRCKANSSNKTNIKEEEAAIKADEGEDYKQDDSENNQECEGTNEKQDDETLFKT